MASRGEEKPSKNDPENSEAGVTSQIDPENREGGVSVSNDPENREAGVSRPATKMSPYGERRL